MIYVWRDIPGHWAWHTFYRYPGARHYPTWREAFDAACAYLKAEAIAERSRLDYNPSVSAHHMQREVNRMLSMVIESQTRFQGNWPELSVSAERIGAALNRQDQTLFSVAYDWNKVIDRGNQNRDATATLNYSPENAVIALGWKGLVTAGRGSQ
jgi:hypothetical protein